MSIRCVLALSFVTFAACGGSDDPSNPDAPTDARPPVDAKPSTVMDVNCTGATPAVTFLTGVDAFLDGSVQMDPPELEMATVNRGQVVKFVATGGHPIGPIPSNPNSDPGLVVPQTQTKCFSFPATGTYEFRCTTHGFAAKLTVN